MNLLIKWLFYALAIIFIAWLVPGISVANFLTAMFVCIIIGFINVFVKPILKVITLPLNIMTLGIFSLILNALLFMLVGYIAKGFTVENFLSALLGSIVLSIATVVIEKVFDKN